MPEVIDEVVTGFVVDDEAQAIKAVGRLGELDRRQVRARFEERFTARDMALKYLDIYARLLEAPLGSARASKGV